eukprot:2131214-Amphidinium_carterae.1
MGEWANLVCHQMAPAPVEEPAIVSDLKSYSRLEHIAFQDILSASKPFCYWYACLVSKSLMRWLRGMCACPRMDSIMMLFVPMGLDDSNIEVLLMGSVTLHGQRKGDSIVLSWGDSRSSAPFSIQLSIRYMAYQSEGGISGFQRLGVAVAYFRVNTADPAHVVKMSSKNANAMTY